MEISMRELFKEKMVSQAQLLAERAPKEERMELYRLRDAWVRYNLKIWDALKCDTIADWVTKNEQMVLWISKEEITAMLMCETPEEYKELAYRQMDRDYNLDFSADEKGARALFSSHTGSLAKAMNAHTRALFGG
jgi:hypothetical protein